MARVCVAAIRRRKRDWKRRESWSRRSDPAALQVLRDSVEDSDAGVRQEVIQSLASVGRRGRKRGLTTARMKPMGLLNGSSWPGMAATK